MSRSVWYKRWYVLLPGSLLLLCLVWAGWFYGRLRASLPQLDGIAALPGVTATVRVERDALGTPTVTAASRIDAARALGFLHAQDRFFQMDLMRRAAAGELAELFGIRLAAYDRQARHHQLRTVAERAFDVATSEERAMVTAYAEGVNAGLSSLGERPFEYRLLLLKPRGWSVVDTYLAGLAMFMDMQLATAAHERSVGLLRTTFPAPLANFLAPEVGPWDTPLDGKLPPLPRLPGPEVFDWRKMAPPPAVSSSAFDTFERIGSNAFALAGARVAGGHALLANDKHLSLRMPPPWYRVQLNWRDASGGEHRITGETLPGAPVVATGSNGRIAWGFTNAFADTSDWIIVETVPGNPSRYLTPDGERTFELVEQSIPVRGGEAVNFSFRSTIWGPVMEDDAQGRPLVLRWVGHSPLALNLRFQALEEAASLEQAVAAARRIGPPTQNVLIADNRGRIAWVLSGAIPVRVGFDGSEPVSWADGTRRWLRFAEPDELPARILPASNALWSANQRHVLEGPEAELVGHGQADLGSRARVIRDRLLELDKATERDLLALQLDARSLPLIGWRDTLLAAGDKVRAALPDGLAAELVEWDGVISPESRAPVFLDAFRSRVIALALSPYSAKAAGEWKGFRWPGGRAQEVALRLVIERPAHLLPPGHADWDALLITAAQEAASRSGWVDGQLGSTRADTFVVELDHPLGRAVPGFRGWLNTLSRGLPGDGDSVRAQGVAFGASQRFVVSPGREAEGISHMPGGQSGHPLSKFYRAGHEAWERGEPTPFLPGPTLHTLELR